MHVALVTTGLLLCTIVIALPASRRHWHASYRNFKIWHQSLSLLILTGSLWHIGGSGFYTDPIEWALLIGLAAIIALLRQLRLITNVQTDLRTLWTLPSVLLLYTLYKSLL